MSKIKGLVSRASSFGPVTGLEVGSSFLITITGKLLKMVNVLKIDLRELMIY